MVILDKINLSLRLRERSGMGPSIEIRLFELKNYKDFEDNENFKKNLTIEVATLSWNCSSSNLEKEK